MVCQKYLSFAYFMFIFTFLKKSTKAADHMHISQYLAYLMIPFCHRPCSYSNLLGIDNYDFNIDKTKTCNSIDVCFLMMLFCMMEIFLSSQAHKIGHVLGASNKSYWKLFQSDIPCT